MSITEVRAWVAAADADGWVMKLPAVIISRASIFPAFEVAAHHENGKVIRRFRTDADMLAWLIRFGYDLIAPDTWSRT